MGAGRCGSGGGGGGIHGAVTVTLDGGGGAALVAVVGMVFAREVGGDGGLATGGLRTRFIVVLAGCAVSFKQSCD